MKKIFGLMTAFLLVGTLSFAQKTANNTATSSVKAKCCTPSKACAKAMGISLEECKKICGSKVTSTSTTDSNVATKAQLVSQTSTKAVNCDPKECAKSCNMSVAECQKKCNGKAGTSQNAANVKLVSQKTAGVKCCAKKKCCKKGLGKATSIAGN